MHPLAHKLGRAGGQRGVVGREHFHIAPLGIQHQQHVGNGLRNGPKPGGRAVQCAFGGQAFFHVVQQQAQRHRGGCEGQQKGQGQGLVDALNHFGRQQLEHRQHGGVHQQPEQRQRHGLDPQAPARPALAVDQAQCGAQCDHHQAHLRPRAAQPQAAGGGHGGGDAGHQRAAKQACHAQHHRAGVKDHPWHQHHRCEHAHHADGAKKNAREHLPGARMLAPDADVEPMQKAQRQQQGNTFDQLNEHGPPCLSRGKPIMGELPQFVNVKMAPEGAMDHAGGGRGRPGPPGCIR